MKRCMLLCICICLLLTACSTRPPVTVTPSKVCELETGTRVDVTGYLNYTDTIKKVTHSTYSYYIMWVADESMTFVEPAEDNAVKFNINEGDGKNHMKEFPIIFLGEADIQVVSDDGSIARRNDLVEIIGKLYKSDTTCNINLEKIYLKEDLSN